MVCNDCVKKLAKRLVYNYKINWIEALERAYKGIERYELRMKNSPPRQIKGFHPLSKQRKLEIYRQFGFNPDYSTSCDESGDCSCPVPLLCPLGKSIECIDNGDCACDCPTPPKANSHSVSNTCSIFRSNNCQCFENICLSGKTCTCECNGLCYYDCDNGFEWDPVAETCNPTQPPSIVAHCSINNKGDTIEVITGTAQEVVDFIRDRRLAYGNVDIIYMIADDQLSNFTVKITYKIPTV